MTTERQYEVLDAFRKFEETGRPPTYADLCRRFGWTSLASARDHIRALSRQGLLVRSSQEASNTSRPWRLTEEGRRLAEAWLEREAGDGT